MMELSFSTFTLYLDDNDLREVSGETSATGLWLKLEELCMTKSLQDWFYLEGKLFGFKMCKSKAITHNLDEFNKLILYLVNIGIKVDDEDKIVIVLNSLPKSYFIFFDTMKYARESLSFEDVHVALKSKEIDNLAGKDSAGSGEGLTIRGRSDKGDNKFETYIDQNHREKKVNVFIVKNLVTIEDTAPIENKDLERRHEKIEEKIKNKVMCQLRIMDMMCRSS